MIKDPVLEDLRRWAVSAWAMAALSFVMSCCVIVEAQTQHRAPVYIPRIREVRQRDPDAVYLRATGKREQCSPRPGLVSVTTNNTSTLCYVSASMIVSRGCQTVRGGWDVEYQLVDGAGRSLLTNITLHEDSWPELVLGH